MKEIALAILKEKPLSKPLYWFENEAYASLLEYMYHGGRVDGYNEKIQPVLKKAIQTLTREDIMVYLSFIVGKDRVVEGFIQKNIENGTIRSLMQRYLELEDNA